VVGTADVHHLEPNRLAAAIPLLSEENLQLHLTQRGARMPRHDAMEGEPARFQLSKRDAQFLQRASVKKVDTTTAIDEHAGEAAHVRIGTHDRIHDQSILSRAGHQPRVVFVPPGNGRLGPVHELGFCRYHSVLLCLMPKVVPFILIGGSEDVILLHIR
jgi:hypothetical protein